jgi:hypothetical protein
VVFAATLQAADNLTANVDGYLNAVKGVETQQGIDLRRRLQDFRGGAEEFRSGIRGGAQRGDVDRGATDLSNRFATIAQLYSRYTSTDRRLASDYFTRATTDMNRIRQTLR